MKKLLLISFAVMITSNLFAQSTVYLIFTSTTEKVSKGVVSGSVYDPKTDRTPTRGYFFVDMEKDYIYNLMYFNHKKDPDNPITTVPLSHLSRYGNIIDWDIEGPTLTKAEVEEFFEILKTCKVYIIDRRDIVNDTMQVVSVELLYKTY